MKYSYSIVIIYTQLFGFKELFILNKDNNLFAQLYGIKYTDMNKLR